MMGKGIFSYENKFSYTRRGRRLRRPARIKKTHKCTRAHLWVLARIDKKDAALKTIKTLNYKVFLDFWFYIMN